MVEDSRVVAQGQPSWCAAGWLALHLRDDRVQPGADPQSGGAHRMRRHGFAARIVASSRPSRWDATPSRRGVDGSYDWISEASASFNPGFSAAC